MAMRSKGFKSKGFEELFQYIDKDEFWKGVKDGSIVVEKEYPNENIKLCKEDGKSVRFTLMDNRDWFITVSRVDASWYGKQFKVESKMGWFPSDCVRVDEVIGFYVCGEPRYRGVFAGTIDWTENGGSASMFADDRDGPWRKMLEENGFKVIDL